MNKKSNFLRIEEKQQRRLPLLQAQVLLDVMTRMTLVDVHVRSLTPYELPDEGIACSLQNTFRAQLPATAKPGTALRVSAN